jgi:Tfp pilus assembly protein PilO
MSITEYTALGLFIVAIIGIVWRISYVLNRKVSYESLDRCKKEVSDNFVSKDIFSLSITTVREDITEIKADVKQLLRKANGRS